MCISTIHATVGVLYYKIGIIHNALCFSSFLLLKKIEKASEMQQQDIGVYI
jgi:hypothetical protein